MEESRIRGGAGGLCRIVGVLTLVDLHAVNDLVFSPACYAAWRGCLGWDAKMARGEALVLLLDMLW